VEWTHKVSLPKVLNQPWVVSIDVLAEGLAAAVMNGWGEMQVVTPSPPKPRVSHIAAKAEASKPPRERLSLTARKLAQSPRCDGATVQ
jgi:hypothetical protein